MPRTIQKVIDAIVAAVPAGLPPQTVDTVKVGDPRRSATGAVVCFMPTQAVLEEAVRLGANLVIAHEPCFYNHLDETAWLAGSPVCAAKQDFARTHGLVVWRFHDLPHRLKPDGIFAGMVEAFGWQELVCRTAPDVCRLPEPVPLRALALRLKAAVGAPSVRWVGAAELPCRHVGILVGAPGGRAQIGFLIRGGIDVLVTGEVAEWETCEYLRDSHRQGRPQGLIVLGHAASEEAGMRALLPWLQARAPGLPMHFVPVGSPFRQD